MKKITIGLFGIGEPARHESNEGVYYDSYTRLLEQTEVMVEDPIKFLTLISQNLEVHVWKMKDENGDWVTE